jgi:hypothetical protein
MLSSNVSKDPNRLIKTIAALLSSPQAIPIAKGIVEGFLGMKPENLKFVKVTLPSWNDGFAGAVEECLCIQFENKDKQKYHLDLTAIPLTDQTAVGIQGFISHRAIRLCARQEYTDFAYVREIALLEQPVNDGDEGWKYERRFSEDKRRVFFDAASKYIYVLPKLKNIPVQDMKSDEKWANFFACVAKGQKSKLYEELANSVHEIALAGSVIESLSF